MKQKRKKMNWLIKANTFLLNFKIIEPLLYINLKKK